MSTSLPSARPQAWATFVQAHDLRRSRALAAAESWLQGDTAPGIGLLAPWRFSTDAAACGRLLQQLVDTPPRATAAHIAATLGPAPATGPDPAGPADQRQHLFEYAAQTDSPAPDTAIEPVTRLAWGLECLAWHGARIDREERGAWATPPKADPKRDQEARALWQAVLSGDFWSIQESVERLLVPPARRAFAAGLRARGVPEDVRRSYISEYAEAFYWTFLGGREGTPGWKDAAVRILEHAGRGPVDALGPHFDAEAWSWLVACPTFSSPSWRATRAWALPRHPNSLSRAWTLLRDGPTQPDQLEFLLDGQVALRLIGTWADPNELRTGPDRSWNVVMRHRSRTRGRLRALLLETASDSLMQLLELPGLYALTAAAVAGQGWSRACQVVHHHQLPAWDSSATPTCEQPPPIRDDFSPDHHRTIRSWMLLALLRNRWPALEHWAHTGTWLKRPDSGWGRILNDGLPTHLRDDDGGYERLQAHLRFHWPEHVRTLQPVVAAIAACRKGPAVREAVLAYWEPEVPLPSRMGKGAIQAAARLLPSLESA